MAREPNNGRALPDTPQDFNARVKRLLADKPEIAKPEPRARAPKPSKPLTRV